MKSNIAKSFLVLTAIALFTQAAIYIFNHRNEAKELASVQNSITTIHLSDLPVKRNKQFAPAVSAAPAIKTCSFATDSVPALAPAVFKEIAWMGSAGSPNDEWFKIGNISTYDVDISGWQVISQSERLQARVPAQTTLTNYRHNFVLKRGQDYTGAIKNEEEGLRLFDANCNLIDEVFADPKWPAGDNEQKITMKRAEDLSWYTTKSAAQEPVEKNSAFITPIPEPPEPKPNIWTYDVAIFEIQAGSEAGANDEFVKLYNAGSQAADLTGWSLKKKTQSGTEYNLVSPSKFKGVIRPGEYFVIAHKDYQGNADLIYSNNSNPLAYSNNSVVLYDGGGKIIDEVFYTKLEKGQVWR